MKISNILVILIIWFAVAFMSAFIEILVLFALIPAYYLTKFIIYLEELEIKEGKKEKDGRNRK